MLCSTHINYWLAYVRVTRSHARAVYVHEVGTKILPKHIHSLEIRPIITKLIYNSCILGSYHCKCYSIYRKNEDCSYDIQDQIYNIRRRIFSVSRTAFI